MKLVAYSVGLMFTVCDVTEQTHTRTSKCTFRALATYNSRGYDEANSVVLMITEQTFSLELMFPEFPQTPSKIIKFVNFTFDDYCTSKPENESTDRLKSAARTIS